jgi:hypothetical protein
VKVSFSSISTALDCEQRYAYRYRDGLRLISAQEHFEIGSIVHGALESVLTAHWSGAPLPPIETAVRDACAKLREKRGMSFDAEENAEIAKKALEYHVPRMDLVSWETVTFEGRPAVELELEIPFGPPEWGVFLQTHIDWIARSKATGKVWIVDHKSSQNRLSDQAWVENDLQLGLYREACKLAGLHIDGAILHQLCVYPPAEPVPLKRVRKGQRPFSVAKNQRTDWETYQNALIRHGENPDDYGDVRTMLDDQCARTPFRRWVKDVTTDRGHAALMRVALNTVLRMRELRTGSLPIVGRVNEWSCGKCEMRSWCDAELLEIDPRSLLGSVYEADDGSPFDGVTAEPGEIAALLMHSHRNAHTDRYDVHRWTPHT